MQQRFDTRKYSIRDFEAWHDNNELVLAPKFQRRTVWPDKARSYLIDTIVRGKPIPKIFMRSEINPVTRRTRREIVDGQQRLSTILNFLKDGFPLLKVHNPEYANMLFSELDADTQTHILQYELAVDLLQNLPDEEIYDIFARLNTYSVVLNPQERRHGNFFGEFKTLVYNLSSEFMLIWKKIFSENEILRMAEAEFISELLIAITVGIRARSKSFIDNFYVHEDDIFPNPEFIAPNIPAQAEIEYRFKETMDIIGAVIEPANPASKLSESRLIYPLFCAIYHMQYGLPEIDLDRFEIGPNDYPKIQFALEKVDQIFNKVQMGKREARFHEQNFSKIGSQADKDNEDIVEYDADEDSYEYEGDNYEPKEEILVNSSGIIEGFDPLYLLTSIEKRFYNAYDNRWVHAANRRIQTEYIHNLIIDALKK